MNCIFKELWRIEQTGIAFLNSEGGGRMSLKA